MATAPTHVPTRPGRRLLTLALANILILGAAGIAPTASRPAEAGATPLVASSATGCTRQSGPPFITRAQWVDAAAAREALRNPGYGSLEFTAHNGKRLRVYTYRPTNFDPSNGRIWFVQHGAQRDADHYVRLALASANTYGTLVLGIEFNTADFPNSEHFAFGIVSSGVADWRAEREGRLLAPDAYLFNEVERLFVAVRSELSGQQTGYYLFGHSAGAQFVHRMMTVVPCARVLGAVAANAGWYTLPIYDGRSGFRLPYSLHGLPSGDLDLRALFSAPMTVLLGANDTSLATEDPNVRATTGAMGQGEHRLARGQYYFDVGQQAAASIGAPFNWRLQIVPDVGHNARHMYPAAARVLFEQGAGGSAAASLEGPATGAPRAAARAVQGPKEARERAAQEEALPIR